VDAKVKVADYVWQKTMILIRESRTLHVIWFVLLSAMAKQFLDQEPDIPFYDVHEVIVPHLGHIPIAKGDFNRLPKKAKKFIAYYVSLNAYVNLVLHFTCI